LLLTAVGPGCADLLAPRNGRIQYYMSSDSSLHANVTCNDGYHITNTGSGGRGGGVTGRSEQRLFLHIRCTGVVWSASVPDCTPGMDRRTAEYVY